MAKRLDCQITGLAILNGAHSKNGHLTKGYIEEPRLPAIIRSVLASGHDAVDEATATARSGTAARRGRVAPQITIVREMGMA